MLSDPLYNLYERSPSLMFRPEALDILFVHLVAPLRISRHFKTVSAHRVNRSIWTSGLCGTPITAEPTLLGLGGTVIAGRLYVGRENDSEQSKEKR